MRNPKRIDKIVKLIKKIWKKNPDLRLTQLISNCFDINDLYYIEDDILENKLKEYYLKNKDER